MRVCVFAFVCLRVCVRVCFSVTVRVLLLETEQLGRGLALSRRPSDQSSCQRGGASGNGKQSLPPAITTMFDKMI